MHQQDQSTALRLVEIPGKGRGFIATEPLKAGAIVFRETPVLVFSAYPLIRTEDEEGNSPNLRYCTHCFQNLTAGKHAEEKTTFTCPICAHPEDGTFCSSKCRSVALSSSHSTWVCRTLSNLRNCSSLWTNQPEERQVQARYLVAAYNLAILSPTAFRTLLSLHGNGERYLQAAAFLHSAIRLPSLPVGLPDLSVEMTAALLDKETCNSFNLMEPACESSERGIRAYGIYPNVSFFNHSCIPNACRFEYLDKGEEGNTDIIIRMLHDVSTGQEICLSYVRINRNYSNRKNMLHDYFGFSCFCDRCKVEANSPSDEYRAEYNCRNNAVNHVVTEELYSASLLAKIVCAKENCGGTLAPLPPTDGNSSDLMECNYCGELTKKRM